MRSIAAALFLFLQLRPLVGAAICFEMTPTANHCTMPEPDQVPRHDSPAHPGTSDGGANAPGCPVTAFCASSAPSLAPVSTSLSVPMFDHGTPIGPVPNAHSAEPTAPPAPPPNA